MKVKYLVIDMNANYAQLIKMVFSKAQIIMDRFSSNQLNVITHLFRADQKKYHRYETFLKASVYQAFYEWITKLKGAFEYFHITSRIFFY